MTEHVHEWIAWTHIDGGGAIAYFRCDCGARLKTTEVEARLNATERLSAEDLFPEGFAIVHPNLDKLIAYANILEDKDA